MKQHAPIYALPIVIVIACASSGFFFAALRTMLEELKEPIMPAAWHREGMFLLFCFAFEAIVFFALAYWLAAG
jgi:hypothetical protein